MKFSHILAIALLGLVARGAEPDARPEAQPDDQPEAAAPSPPFESAAEFREWSNGSEFEPTAPRLIAGLSLIVDDAYHELSDAEQLGVAAFFGGVFSEDPDLMDPMIDRFVPAGRPSEIRLLLHSIWLADSETARERLAAIRDAKGPAEIRMFSARLLESPLPIDEQEQINTGLQLDLLWGRYMGSRDPAPIRRIISVLEEPDENAKTGIDLALARRAAIRSLYVMSTRHPDVLDICRAQIEELETDKGRHRLTQIVSAVEEAGPPPEG